MLLLIGCFILGYATTAISDFMIHRYIWHGQWQIVKMDFFKRWLFPHYLHHMVAHHSHSIKAKEELQSKGEVPRALKEAIEDRFKDDAWLLTTLKCSNHGLSITTPACVLNYLSLFALTPHLLLSFLVALWLGGWAGLVIFTPCLLAVFTQINHRFYHMTPEARKRHAPGWLRWFFCSKEFNRLVVAHQKHHYFNQHHDDFYSMIPFAYIFTKPIFGKS